ncbi:MAG: hypothetical protein EXS36_02170 [Pedosphaera sp.]|nr:hypothetical protein [Pedosphaera sp.]
MRSGRQPLHILLCAALLLGAWSLFLRRLPIRAQLAESNYQANVIRLQDFLFQPVRPAVFVGSSITGRLLAGYFSATLLEGSANLGLDGSGPRLGIELLVLQKSTPPPWLFVEANLLGIPPGSNDAQLLEATHGLTFSLARRISLFRAETRPSSLLYSWLKQRRNDAHDNRIPPLTSSPPAALLSAPLPITWDRSSPEERALHRNGIRQGLLELRRRGTQVVLLRFPHADVPEDPAARDANFGDELARELQLPQWELGPELRASGISPTFSDGTHLTPGAARSVARLIAGKTAQLFIHR